MAGGGVVAAGHPATAAAGAAVLRAGGNAVDAAVAAVLTSLLAEPLLTGLGAGGYLLVTPPGGPPVLLDFFVEVPARGSDVAPLAELTTPAAALVRRGVRVNAMQAYLVACSNASSGRARSARPGTSWTVGHRARESCCAIPSSPTRWTGRARRGRRPSTPVTWAGPCRTGSAPAAA